MTTRKYFKGSYKPVSDKTRRKIAIFLGELEILCETHKMQISHEDGQGSFLIDMQEEPGEWIEVAIGGL
jgi:hypothetical protein